jgi:hypothetical protein
MSHIIKTPNLSLFLGRRNTGKSTLMVHILKTLAKAQKFAWVRVYSPTAFTGVWGAIVGEDNVEAVFDADELESILESQAGIRSRGGKNEGLVILDDCLGACSFQNDLWTRIASSGRHYGLTFWVSAQHCFKLAPVIRSNADYIYLLGVQGDRVVKSLYEEAGGLGIPSWQEFREKVAAAVRDFGALVIDSHDQRTPLRTIRAPSRPSAFRIQQ